MARAQNRSRPISIRSMAPVNLYFGVNPVLQHSPGAQEQQERKTYRPNPGNVRPLVEEISALNCLYAEYDAEDFGDSKEADRRPYRNAAGDTIDRD